MSEINTHPTKQHAEHGSVRFYAVGFLASLVLTIIPYYLVTQQILLGTTLLIVILAFGILQMFVQMFFFLHLGRGPKPLYNVAFFGATAGLIVIVVGASILIMNNLYHSMSPEEYTTRLAQEENIAQVDGTSTGACQENKDNNASFMIMVQNSGVSPQHVDAKRCDTLIFMSHDGKNHTIKFGTEASPSSYGGEFELNVTSSRTKAITLNQTGDFSYFDASNPKLTGHFSVKD